LADITLIHPSSKFLINPTTFSPMGIMYLSASLKLNKFTTQCLDFNFDHTISDVRSKVVGISFTTSQKEEAFEIADLLKKHNKILIAGGAHATHLPYECLPHFDYVVRGEADHQLPELLTKILNDGNLVDRVFSAPEPNDLDSLPIPDRDSLLINSYNYFINDEKATTLMSSRSCPYSCSFCGKISNNYRIQSAQRTVNEILYLHSHYKFKAFMIFDDIFVEDTNRLKEIVRLLKNTDFVFRGNSRSNFLTKEVCKLLKEMNFVEVGIGVESGSNEILKINMKGISQEQNTHAIENLREVGIRSKAFMIIGLPGENKNTLEETRGWIERAKPDDIDLSVFQPMPGSNIYNNSENYGIKFDKKISGLWYKGTPNLYRSISSTKELSSEQIIEYRDEFELQFKNKDLLK
jgi:anaerobic magnesium-protoporphyrin IX monomethyl ester cyclase